MRLIDADAGKKRIIKEIAKNLSELNAVTFAISTGIAEMFDSEEDFPTVDAELVRHGKWIKRGGDKYPYYECSKCDYSNNMVTPYCANCGAKMVGGDE